MLYALKPLANGQSMTPRKPLAFNILAAIALAVCAWRGSVTTGVVQDLCIGAATALGVILFSRLQIVKPEKVLPLKAKKEVAVTRHQEEADH